jgi:hypothetical protein
MALSVNNVAFDWSNIEVSVAGQATKIDGITAIKFEWTRDTAYLRGRGNKPLGITDGQINFSDITMTLNLSAYQSLVNIFGYESMKNAGANGVTFDVVVTVAKAGVQVTRTLEGCTPVGESSGWSQGPDGLQTEITLKCLDIVG